MNENILVQVEHLKKYFPVKGVKGPGVQAVEDVSFLIHEGETLGLVGESGCGKTTLGRTVLRLHEPTQGRILYRGGPIYDYLPDEQGRYPAKIQKVNMMPYRRKMQIIFQDPSASLDPRMTVGEIIGEALDIHKLYGSKKERTDRIKELLGSPSGPNIAPLSSQRFALFSIRSCLCASVRPSALKSTHNR